MEDPPQVPTMLHSLLFVAAALELPVHPTHLLVKPRAERTAAEVSGAELRARALLVREVRALGWRVLEVAPERLAAARDELLASGAFEHVDFDHAKRLAYTPNDPYWPGMWHATKIRANVAWDTSLGSSSVVVAVMDTGLETSHPDLAANVWANPGEIANNGLDDDANGYVDDVHGYDFAYGDSTPDDQYGHGTACAGLVAAVQDNAIGVTGVAPLARLAGVKAALDSGYFYDSANVPALVYCADMGFDVVSMSFYSDQVTAAERDAIDYCWANGVLPIAAAGNDASVFPFYPGAYERVLCVAATSYDDSMSWFSDHGTWVDVASPGEGLSTVTVGGGYTTGFAGTSGATPQVAGLAALLFGAVPGSTNASVRAAIEDSAVPLVQAPYGWISRYGRIDCASALARLQAGGGSPVVPRLDFVAPCAGRSKPVLAGSPAPHRPTLSFFGRGFEAPGIVRALQRGIELPLLAQTRERVDAKLAFDLQGKLELELNGSSVGSIRWDPIAGFAYAPSDADTTGGGSPVALGGFAELHRRDGNVFTCTRRDDNSIYVRAAIRAVDVTALTKLQLEFVRSYTATTGTETISLYDWSTASYPYGSFVAVATTGVSSGSTLAHTFPIANPARFFDDEGTAYVVLQTTGAGATGKLSADCLRLIVE